MPILGAMEMAVVAVKVKILNSVPRSPVKARYVHTCLQCQASCGKVEKGRPQRCLASQPRQKEQTAGSVRDHV